MLSITYAIKESNTFGYNSKPCFHNWPMTIGERIRAARKRAGKTQEEIGNLFEISRPSVAQWESDKTYPGGDKLAVLARVLGVSVDWLLSGVESPNRAEQPHAPYNARQIEKLVPRLSWVTAGKLCATLDALSAADAEEWLPCPVDYKLDIYALTVSGSSMDDGSRDSYPDGIMIFIDPTLQAGHNDDVVIMTPDGRATFKRYQETPDGAHLLAINPAYNPRITPVPEGSSICGVVVFSGRRRRR